MPIVFFDRIVDEIETHKVIVDNYKSAYDATSQLVKNGYQRIAAISNAALPVYFKRQVSRLPRRFR